MDAARLQAYLAERPPGHSLPGAFYREPELYAHEVDTFLAAHWICVGHVSELAAKGDFFTVELYGHPLVVLRGANDRLAAFHNVCRHRGARVCEAPRGTASLLRCRYHQWSYRLDGSLAAWRQMPPELDRDNYGLRRCGVAVCAGMILVSLRPDRAADPDAIAAYVEPAFARYELARCRIARTQTYSLRANWKLGIENNLECYHCIAGHPEFTVANSWVRADERVSAQVVEEHARHRERWRADLERAGVPTERIPLRDFAGQPCRAGIWPLSPGFATSSRDGRPVAPRLGSVAAHDGSVTTGCVGFLSYLAAMSDHALLVTYVPRAVDATDVVLRWLVHEDAQAGVDYVADEVCWLWDRTTTQDKDLIELNAAGVRSPAYVPGPYSSAETMTADFVERYVALLAART